MLFEARQMTSVSWVSLMAHGPPHRFSVVAIRQPRHVTRFSLERFKPQGCAALRNNRELRYTLILQQQVVSAAGWLHSPFQACLCTISAILQPHHYTLPGTPQDTHNLGI